jgi:branched-subunit amino acid ABC-type transport system permease component
VGLVDAYLIPTLDGAAYGLLLFVVAAGLTAAFSVGGVLNLAHGSLYAVGAYTAAALGDGTWTGLALAVAVGIVAGAAGGGVLAAAVAPLAGRGHLAQALLTFGAALVAADGLTTVFGPDELPVAIPTALDASTSIAGHRYPAYRLAFIAAALALAAAGWVAVAHSRVGARVRAAVDDPQMLACLGVNPRTVQAGVLATAGGLAGLAGVLGAPILGPGPGTANAVLLLSLVVVVLGGLGRILGALAAAVVVGLIHTLGVTLAAGWAPFLLFAAMAAALIIRPARQAGSPA